MTEQPETTDSSEGTTTSASEPAVAPTSSMVVIDGVRYQPNEVPMSEPAEPQDVLKFYEPGYNVAYGRDEEELIWNQVGSGRRGYPSSAGGSGRSGYPTIS